MVIEAKKMSDIDAQGFEENFEHLSHREKILMEDRQHWKALAEFRAGDSLTTKSRSQANYIARERQIRAANGERDI